MREGVLYMKGEIRNKYIEYVNHIDFPLVLYVYETNKVIAINGYAKEIIGDEYEDIREMFNNKKFRLCKDLSQPIQRTSCAWQRCIEGY